MAEIIVAGAGICGLATALMLSRDGHQVTVIDRDPGPLPTSVEEAWAGWARRSVSQFRFGHILTARGTRILADELPDVIERFEANGAPRLNPVKATLARTGIGALEPEDDRFDIVAGRRPTYEWVLACVAEEQPGLTVRRGAVIEALCTGPEVVAGTPHVTGVRLEGGEQLTADLVVDVTGRNSPTPRWLAAIGARAPQEVAEDSGFAYYGRFFRSADGSLPAFRAPALTPMGSMSILTIPSDNGTWSVVLYAASDDAPLRRLRRPEVYERVVRSMPAHAHWIDAEPISELASMAGVVDRSRRFVLDGQPVATGLISIADAVSCTNPSLGRGMTIGLLHAQLARTAIAEHLDDPLALAVRLDELEQAHVAPWHAATRAVDRSRRAEMEAIAAGREPEDDLARRMTSTLSSVVPVDPVALRASAELGGCLAFGADVFSRPGLVPHLLAVAAEKAVPPPPGPDRAQLLALVG